ncbi:MAG: dihydropteroate synthase [Hydrogenobaculum sp.]
MKITFLNTSKEVHVYIKRNIHYSIKTEDVSKIVPSYAVKFEGFLEKNVLENAARFGVFCHNQGKYAFVIGNKFSIFELLKATKPRIAQELIKHIVNFDKEHRYNVSYNTKVLHLSDMRPLVMGVINITKDSFYPPSRVDEKDILFRVEEFIKEGADIIDIGAQSTRPGAEEITSEEEVYKLLEPLKKIRKEFKNVWISIDTYFSNTARVCLEEGADIINDISGGVFDDDMLKTIAVYNCPYIIGHSSSYKPNQWPHTDFEYEDITLEIINHFKSQETKLLELGYNLFNGIILDPCIGFAKKPMHNLEILNQIEAFRSLDRPILIGTSRKSFIGIVIKEFLQKESMPSPEQRLIGSLGSIAQSITKNACHIVRTHDVAATKEFIALLDAVRNYHYA